MSMAASAGSAAVSAASSKFRKPSEGGATTPTTTPTTPDTPDVPEIVVEKPKEKSEKSSGMKLKKKGKLDEINWDEIEADAKDSSDQGNGWGKGVTIIVLIIKCTLLITINHTLLVCLKSA